MESFSSGTFTSRSGNAIRSRLSAAKKLLEEAKVDPESVGLLIYGGTPGSMAFAPSERAESAAAGLCTMSRFKYPSTRLQYDLDLPNASTFALDQLACTTLLAAVRIALHS
jgi:3-oxoacyl-[acyl-carrier-protein] synthase III